MDKEHIPGIMLTLVSGDSVVFAGGLGFVNIEKGIPINKDHLFRLGSIT